MKAIQMLQLDSSGRIAMKVEFQTHSFMLRPQWAWSVDDAGNPTTNLG